MRRLPEFKAAATHAAPVYPLWCINGLPELPIFRPVYQTIRTEAGMPSLVIRLNTLHPIFASIR